MESSAFSSDVVASPLLEAPQMRTYSQPEALWFAGAIVRSAWGAVGAGAVKRAKERQHSRSYYTCI